MSHFTKLDKANIKSPQAFIEACKELGLTNIKENNVITDYYGNKTTAAVSVKVGEYDIGLQENDAGNFDMIADWWGVRKQNLPGEMTSKMKSKTEDEIQNCMLRYTTKHTITARYKKAGYKVNVSENEDRSLVVNLTKY